MNIRPLHVCHSSKEIPVTCVNEKGKLCLQDVFFVMSMYITRRCGSYVTNYLL